MYSFGHVLWEFSHLVSAFTVFTEFIGRPSPTVQMGSSETRLGLLPV